MPKRIYNLFDQNIANIRNLASPENLQFRTGEEAIPSGIYHNNARLFLGPLEGFTYSFQVKSRVRPSWFESDNRNLKTNENT